MSQILKSKIIVVDDHFITRAGIIKSLEKNKNIEIVGEGRCGQELVQLFKEKKPHLIITDLQMPEYLDKSNGNIMFKPIDVCRKLISQNEDLKILVISQVDDVHMIQFLAQIGISGFMLKSDNSAIEIEKAVELIIMGGTYFSNEVKEILFDRRIRKKVLTDRQIQVLQEIIDAPDLTREAMAKKLGISVHTLQKHIKIIFEIMDVNNMTACLIKAMRMQVISIDYS